MFRMIRTLYFLFFALISVGLFTGARIESEAKFQGEILYQKADLADTVNLKMYFKDSKVRVDYFNASGILHKYKLINFTENLIYTVNPSRKLYVQNQLTAPDGTQDPNIEIDKTGNHKQILGYTGYQWIVKNKKRNSVVSYWVTEEDYDYYTLILDALNRTDKIVDYFGDIPENEGYLILEAEEFSLVRERRMCLRALDMKKRQLNENLFELPANYQLFE